jgi:hypothetical protein
MKNRQEALSKLAEGLDQIIADHAERLAKQKAGAPEEEMEGEEEGEEEGMDMSAGGAGLTPIPEPGDEDQPMAEEGEMPVAEEGEEMPEGEEDDEMSKVKRELADRLKSQPKAIRR